MAAKPAVTFGDWPLKPKDLHLKNFQKKGTGSFGKVYVGEWQGRPIAVKMLHDILLGAGGDQTASLVASFKEECLKLRRLDHGRVVKLIATYRDECGRPLLVMEAQAENLEAYLRRNAGKLTVVRQITIVNELADGLAYLHENNIVHRDLKPANVMVGKDGGIRIADLGQAKLLPNGIEQLMQTTQPGTPLFLPPEALRHGESHSYTVSIDCFSLGVVALCVATQAFPTCDWTEIGAVEEAVRRKNDLDKLPQEHPLESIILGCLQNTPSLRPHSFFIKVHTQALLDKLSLESQLETKSRTVIELMQYLESQKRRAESLQTEKLLEKRNLESQLETKSLTVMELRQDLDRRKQCTERLQEEKQAVVRDFQAAKEIWMQEKAVMEYELQVSRQQTASLQREKSSLVSQLGSKNRIVVELRETLESQKQQSAAHLRKEKYGFESGISALKEDNAKYVDQVCLLQERRVAEQAEFEARFSTLQADAKVKIDSCRNNLAGVLGLLANFDTNLQPFSDCGPSVASKQTSLPTPDNAHLPQQPSADGKSPQAAQTARSSLPHQNRAVVDEQMPDESHQVSVPLAKSHRKLVVSKGNILYAKADIKVIAISSPTGFNVGQNASLNRALAGLLQQAVDRRYQSSRPDNYDVFTIHCSPNCKVNCRFLVVANILDHNLGRRSDAPKFLQQIMHSVCREADTLEMPTAAIAPGTFDCGGFPKDSILPAFIKMLNEYNSYFTNDEFLTEVNVFAMSEDDFSVLVQSAERTVGQPLLQPRNHPPRPPSQPTEGYPATGSSFVGNVASTISSWLRSGSSNDKVQDEPPPQHTRNIPSTPVNLSTSQPAHCSSITMGSKCTLSVKLGSTIVEDAVDAVVNPTNGNLDLVSDISSVLNAASRGVVKRECTALVSRRGGPVPPGSVAVTESGGQLKNKLIIHVNVYDTEVSSIQGCSQLLLKSIANVLQVAENKHLSSVALTPFFPHTSGLELTSEMIAHYFIDAIVHSSFPEQSSLKELLLLVDDKQSFVTFQKELLTVSSMITATLPHPAGQSHARQVQPPKTEPRNVVHSPSTEPDVFEIPTQSSRRRLVVKKSHFLHEVADIKIVAICSEDQKHPGALNLNKILKGALVESITRRYHREKPSQFDVFTVHCPPEATLQCRFLVVVNILDRNLGQGADSHKHLNQILHNVCREADTLEMPTVAIASATFDIGGFPRESVLTAFVRMISQYNFTNDDFLTDVKFLTTSTDAFASMCAVVKHSFGTPEVKLVAMPPHSPAGSPYTQGAHCSPSSYHGRDVPNVQVVVGDIVSFLAGAVVVPVNPNLDLKEIVSEAVNNATHGQLRLKVKNLKIKDGDVVPYKRSLFVTSQWNIKATHLYLLCRSKTSQIDTLKKGLASALEEATFHNLKSIAFPIPFLSKKVSKTATADFVKALKDVVTLHQATNPAIVVTVVVSKSEPPAVLKSLQESFMQESCY